MHSIFKKTYFIISAALLLGAAGCSKSDLIDLTPEFNYDAITNPSSMDQVEQVLIGAYEGFRNGNYYGSGSGTGNGWGMMADVMSDNLYETLESLANSRAMADWLYESSTGQVAGMFNAPYVVIARANVVLRDIDKFTTASNQTLANRIKGQALAIRALAHFDLFRYFAERYDRNSTTDLAVPYITEFAVSPSIKPARLNNKEFYDRVFADLTAAIPLLSNVDKVINPANPIPTRPYIDLNGVYAIQARAYLYAGMYPEAATAATNAIAGRPLVSLNQSAFSGMYDQSNVGEIIWNVQFESNQSGPTFLVYFATNQRSYFRPAPEVATSTGTSGLIQTGDIRYTAFFSNVGGDIALTKYKGKGGISDGNANFIAFRTGEMYLIRAEARAKNSQEGLAMDDLNDLRAARIPGYTDVSLSGQALLDAIADERRRELIGEGHRFFDLKRTTRTIQRGSACGSAISVAGDCTLAAGDREWALPIPDAEMDFNENMVQNTDY